VDTKKDEAASYVALLDAYDTIPRHLTRAA
jgi:hypothetical protein